MPGLSHSRYGSRVRIGSVAPLWSGVWCKKDTEYEFTTQQGEPARLRKKTSVGYSL